MSLILNFLIMVCSIIGIIVCVLGMKTKNILYKGGLFFFILFLVEKLYSLIAPILIQRIINHGIDNPGLWVRNLSIPPLLLMATAVVILLVFLFKGLRKNKGY